MRPAVSLPPFLWACPYPVHPVRIPPFAATQRRVVRDSGIFTYWEGRPPIRHLRILALVFTIPIGVSEARADMITYNMTGTIRMVHLNNLFPGSSAPPVAVGDRIAWTFRYDSSTPLNPYRDSGPSAHYYELNNLAVSHLVDTTSGFHFYAPPNVNSTTLVLENLLSGGGTLWTSSALWDAQRYLTIYEANLDLGSPKSLPTLDLANLSLTAPPFTPTNGDLTYAYKAFSFMAATDSISLASVAEPGSLTLFVLGIGGLIARRLRPSIWDIQNVFSRNFECPQSQSRQSRPNRGFA